MNSPALESKRSRAGDSIRLNLGGRSTRIEGFTTVDLEPGSDVVADVSDLRDFEGGSVDEIYASHILEHFPHVTTLTVLKEWHRVLKNGGKLYISVPDFDAVVKLFQNHGGLSDFLVNLMYGDQIYGRAYHYTIFTFARLAALCDKAGFADVRRIKELPYGVKDCSKLLDSFSLRPISLNVEAIA